jgi:predicted DNA-binding transcriptional regulator AlpA
MHQLPRPSKPSFLTAKETAAFLGLSEITLARWRMKGVGPSYRKFGRRVRYAIADLIAWADEQIRESTSQLVSKP